MFRNYFNPMLYLLKYLISVNGSKMTHQGVRGYLKMFACLWKTIEVRNGTNNKGVSRSFSEVKSLDICSSKWKTFQLTYMEAIVT